MTMANTAVSPQRTGVSLRKTNKPLMEKRRRARINDSLTQLKSLVIQSSKKDSSQFNKLEKADILELTVKHLRNLQEQHQQQLSQANNTAAPLAGKYQAGFMECAHEVIRYLEQSQSFSDDVKTRVIHHLASCVQLSSKLIITKPTSTAVSTNSSMSTGYHTTNTQFVNGQAIQILNNQIPNIKSSTISSFPGQQSTSVNTVSSSPSNIPVSSTPNVTPCATPLSQPPCYMKYTQPLQIQIPPTLSPSLIHSKTEHQKANKSPILHKIMDTVPKVISQLTNNKESLLFSNSPPPQPKDKYIPLVPFRACQKSENYYAYDEQHSYFISQSRTCQKSQNYYTYDEQHSDFIPRSRTYSLTSSSSESELASPLNLSQSPQNLSHSPQNLSHSPQNLSQSPKYYHHGENSNKYPSQVGNHYTHRTIQSDISGSHPITRDVLLLSHCPSSNVTSVIVDGRRTSDSHSMKYMQLLDEERHFVHHEGSTSPASSVGEERLWRPW